VLREENAIVLPFRDSALRRPIDVVAWRNTHLPYQPDHSEAPDNVVPLARSQRGGCRTWLGGPPEGAAA
jgi:hypothetical protein